MRTKRKSSLPILDIAEVALEWDPDQDKRARMRDEKSVLKPGPACQDISTCIQHRGLLIPLLERMAVHDHRPVPQINALKEEVLSLLKVHKLGVDSQSSSDSTRAKTAWAIRKLCGFVKGKVRRQEVSTVPRMCNLSIGFSHWKLLLHQFSTILCEFLAGICNTVVLIHSALSTHQVKSFQDLCLILDPMLQAASDSMCRHPHRVMLQIVSADLRNLHVEV